MHLSLNSGDLKVLGNGSSQDRQTPNWDVSRCLSDSITFRNQFLASVLILKCAAEAADKGYGAKGEEWEFRRYQWGVCDVTSSYEWDMWGSWMWVRSSRRHPVEAGPCTVFMSDPGLHMSHLGSCIDRGSPNCEKQGLSSPRIYI